ncbi:alpha/beta fold hydrolase [Halomonas sp. TRM85114]|uniref:alpha/beta fold hydrolase n=1 Tax=Halomonas jincaotanensis TaxID=2810616 RepID=UPI001BD2D641|nr:alpha/beta fold hydrolase [Halomonas jincaotanensis]MBS9403969.1 alpha/beta fold hydrolase [Halomonas jincaotanensis]
MSALVLLSGWGCDARIWQPLAPYWPSGLEVTTPDWPGYGEHATGGSLRLDDPANMRALADAMADALPAEAVWVGWSLGGLLITALLDYLPAPRALVLLGMGSRLCVDCGISLDELDAFQRAFARAPDATRQHFLRWQLQGELAPRKAHRRLLGLLGETSLGETPCVDNATLAAGLAQLASLDLTDRLTAPPCPVWRVAGEHDPLLAPALRESADYRLADAGHCPMLTQPEALASCLTDVAEKPGRHRVATPSQAISS